MSKRLGRSGVREDGQGLIELIVALTVLAIGIGSLLTVLTSSALSLQRSGQKGTALTLAEKQIELYRNLSFPDIRLDSTALQAATSDVVYANAYKTDPNMSTTGEVTNLTAGMNLTACPTEPECMPIQFVGPGTATPTPDNRKYRIDTFIHTDTPNGGSSDIVLQVYVVVRNAQIATYPILARSASTFSPINIANVNGKAIVTMAFNTQRAAIQNTNPDVNAISATLSGGAGETGSIDFYVMSPPSTPSPPCSGAAWQPFDSVNVSGDGTYHPSPAAGAAFKFSSTGTYYWYATYTGDSANKKASAVCGATMASTSVKTTKWTPTLTLSSSASAVVNKEIPGSSITATLAGSSGYTPNNVSIMISGPTNTAPSSCGGAGWQSAGQVKADGNGSYSPSATGFTPSTTGRYWWYATFPSDSTNNVASSLCNGSTSIAHIDVTVPPDTFQVVPATTTPTAGTAFNVQITACTPTGTCPDAAYTGTKTLSYTGPSNSSSGTPPTYQPSVVFTNGGATVPVTLVRAETTSITVTEGQVTGSSASITVGAASIAGFAVTSAVDTTTVGSQVAGTPFNVTLTAIDQNGNPTAYSGTHTITLSGPANAPNGKAPDYPATNSLSFSSGVGGPIVGITLYNAASTTLTATETAAIKGSSLPFTVKGATPQSLTFVNCSPGGSTCKPQPISIGNNGSLTANVGLLDTWGNPANATSGLTIGLTSSNTSNATVTTSVDITQGSTQSAQLKVAGKNPPTATITAQITAGTPPPPASATATLQVKK
ncbi:MAG TPA: type II secretion system protein [Gaiellaceae bacterium]|jgi:type II secretory pathway pseudopilin PulG|nr:type II secretion system protein [Gaiellaceae bacterium]